MASAAGGRVSASAGVSLLSQQSGVGQSSRAASQHATVYVGNLDSAAHEALVYELFLQFGPVLNVYMPKDRVSGAHQGYGFVEFASERDAEYSMKVANMVKLFNKPLKVNKAASDRRETDVGANLFIGNLDPSVDEKLLYDTFSAFGLIIGTPKVMRDADTGQSKGFGFVSFDCFEASDAAIDTMHNQYLCNRPITVNYALKKGSKHERHGDAAERMLATNSKQQQSGTRDGSSAAAQPSSTSSSSRPHQQFASTINSAPPPPPPSDFSNTAAHQQSPQPSSAMPNGAGAAPAPPPAPPPPPDAAVPVSAPVPPPPPPGPDTAHAPAAPPPPPPPDEEYDQESKGNR